MEINNKQKYQQPHTTVIATKPQQHIMTASADNHHGPAGNGSGNEWEYGSNAERSKGLSFWEEEWTNGRSLWEE